MWAAIAAARQNAYKYDRFRNSFHLDFNDLQAIKERGYFDLEKHAYDIIADRLKVKPLNDGKQTPYRGHPIFKAQHATACCCRKCLQRWHGIPEYRELTDQEVGVVVGVVMQWIRKEMISAKNSNQTVCKT